MSTQESSIKHVGDHWAFVGVAYILTFGVWTGVTGNDFISSSWRSVEATRKRGLWHLCLTTLPMLYMIAYMTFQGLVQDFKEMWTAFVAFVFAVVHVIRTICGLWQVHIFKQWIVQSIRCMESLGYYASNCKLEKCVSECPNKKRKFRESECPLNKGSREDRINRKADAVLVNETLIDNRLSEGDVTCFLRFGVWRAAVTENFSESEFSHSFNKYHSVKRLFSHISSFLRNVWRILCMVCTLARSRTPEFTTPKGPIYLEPRRPEEIWLGWACVFLSDVFPEWLKDMKKAEVDYCGEKYSNERYEACRAQFAVEVLLSAGLQTACKVPIDCVGAMNGLGEGNISDVDRRNFSECSEASSFSCGLSMFDYLSNSRCLELRKGLFRKQEFLSFACREGSGLPFGVEHRNAKRLDDGKEVYGYLKYALKLDRVREGLPAEMGEKIQGFGVDELEWLTVLLAISNWNLNFHALKNMEKPGSDIQSEHSDDLSTVDVTYEDSQAHGCDSENEYENSNPGSDSEDDRSAEDFSFSNLKDQLGFKDKLEHFICKRRMNSFPLLRYCSSHRLWGNRNLLELSIHIDNFLALSSGAHVIHMLEHALERKESKSWKVPCPELSRSSQNYIASRNGIWSTHIDLAKESLMFQFTLKNPEHKYLEQSMTFLGCSIEGLRTSLAKWEARNPEHNEEAWSPKIISNGRESGIESERIFKFPVSAELAFLLFDLKVQQASSQRYVEMRMLWELQNYFQEQLPPTGISPAKEEAMILCVLSFPAIGIEFKDPDLGRRGEGAEVIKGDGEWALSFSKKKTFRIRAVCAPQDVLVEVLFENQGKLSCMATVQLVVMNDESENKFMWEAWRDAFGGRMEGVRSWQKKHRMVSVDVNQNYTKIDFGIQIVKAENLGTGKSIQLWRGWMPFRTAISRFEVESEGFILKRRKIQRTFVESNFDELELKLGRFRKTSLPTNYSSASGIELQHASFVAHEAIRRVSSLKGSLRKTCRISVTAIEEKAKLMLESSDINQRRLGVLVIEEIATEQGDFSAVRNAVKLLIHEKAEVGDVRRALAMIGSFCSDLKSSEWKLVHSPVVVKYRQRMESEAIDFLESLLGTTDHDAVVSEWYARTMMEAGESGIRSRVRTALSTSILRTAALSSTAAGLKRAKGILASSLPCETKDEAALSIGILFPETALTQGPDKIEDVALRLLPGKGMAKNELLARKLLERAVEEREYAPALVLLGLFARYERGDIPRNDGYSASLYERALRQGNENAMVPLADILHDGADNVSVNTTRAVKLCANALHDADGDIDETYLDMDVVGEVARSAVNKGTRWEALEELAAAIEKFGDEWLKIKVATFLASGSDGVPGYKRGALSLLKNAIDTIEAWKALDILRDIAKSASWQKILGNVLPETIERLIEVITTSSDFSRKMILATMLQKGASGFLADKSRASRVFVNAVDELLERSASDVKNDWMTMNHLREMVRDLHGGWWIDVADALERFAKAIEKFGDWNSKAEVAKLLKNGNSVLRPDPVRAIKLLKGAIDEFDDDEVATILHELASGRYSYSSLPLVEYPELVEQLFSEIDTYDSLPVRIALARIFIIGFKHIRPDVARGVALVEIVIDELRKRSSGNFEYSVELGFSLTLLLEDVMAGRWAYAPDVVEKLLSSIEESEKVPMYHLVQLACIRKLGWSGVDPDTLRAIGLIEHVIDESLNSENAGLRAFFEFIAQLEGGLWADSPSVIEKCVFAAEKIGDCTVKLKVAQALANSNNFPSIARSHVARLFTQSVEGRIANGNIHDLDDMLETLAKYDSDYWADTRCAFENHLNTIENSDIGFYKIIAARVLKKGIGPVQNDTPRASKILRAVIEESIHRGLEGFLDEIAEDLTQGLWVDVPLVTQEAVNAIEKCGSLKGKMQIAKMLKGGTYGVPQDADRGLKMFQIASKEALEKDAICVLEDALKDIREGLWEEAPRIIEQILAVLGKDGSISSRIEIAVILKFGAPGTRVDVERAINMITEAMNELLNSSISSPDRNDGSLERVKRIILEEFREDTEFVAECFFNALEHCDNLAEKINIARIPEAKGVFSPYGKHAARFLHRAIDKATDWEVVCILDEIVNAWFAGNLFADVPGAVRKCVDRIEKTGKAHAKLRIAYILSNGVPCFPANPSRATEFLQRTIEDSVDWDSIVILEEIIAQSLASGNLFMNVPGAVDNCIRRIDETATPRSRTRLAQILCNGAPGVEADPLRGVQLLEHAIEEENNTSFIITLALLLQNGRCGVPVDARRSVAMLQNAVDSLGCPIAAFHLAALLQFGGEGLSEDKAAAARMYENSIAAQDSRPLSERSTLLEALRPLCENNLGVLLEGEDAARASKLYRNAIYRANHFGALYNLAVLLKYGAKGISADLAQARKLYERAVKAGAPVCAQNLASSLSEQAVRVYTYDRSKEALHYAIAIENGPDAIAMHNLAVLLQIGAPGVPANPPRAVSLFKRAAFESGHIGAMEKLGNIFQNGADGVPQNADASAWWLARSREFATFAIWH